MRVPRDAIAAALALGVGLGGAVALAQDASQDAPAEPAKIPRIQVSGTLKFVVSLTVSPTLPNGTQLTIAPQVTLFDDKYFNFSQISGTVKISGGKASLTLLLPYTWLVASTSDKVSVSIQVNGSSFKGDLSYSDASNFTKTFTLPANGKTTTLSFAGAI
jgi:hypothetical protein